MRFGPRSARKTLAAVAVFLACYVLLVAVIFFGCRELAFREAEKNLGASLFYHQAIREFFMQVQRPEIARLKDQGHLYRGYFSPVLLSCTYISTHINEIVNRERQRQGLEPVFFKLAAQNPRNPLNRADEGEMRLLDAFNRGTLDEYKERATWNGRPTLYHAIPVAPTEESCLRCHGEPHRASEEMLMQYGDQAGFYEKVGDIRGLLAVHLPLEGLLREANRIAVVLAVIALLLMAALLFATLLSFRRLDEQKRLAQERFRYLNSILQSSTDTAIVATDDGLVIRYFNPEAERLFGVPANKALGANIHEVHARVQGGTGGRFQAAMARVHEKGSHSFRLTHRGKVLEARVSCITDADGVCAGYLLLGHDVTALVEEERERERMSERLRQAEKMESIGLMAGGVAHDLNNILSGLVTYPELLLLELPPDSELRETVQTIRQSGQRAAAVVADLLTVARGVASARETVDLNQVVARQLQTPEALRLREQYPRIEFTLKPAPEGLPVSCSVTHVAKCLHNLLLNAAEAVGEFQPGRVVVATGREELCQPPAGISAMEPGNYAVVRVIDSGPGIAEEDRRRIFEPFYSRKKLGRSGTGLGLTVVWNTMLEHKGGVTVQADARGSCFTLYFPCVTGQVDGVAVPPAREEPRGHGERILVVDDEAIQRDVAGRLLTHLGYRVETALSGEAALTVLGDHAVDLVVLDMLMEPGMNGRETYEKMLALRPGQKAIIASGFSESEEVKRALALGASQLLKKPYSVEQLGLAVRQALGDGVPPPHVQPVTAAG